ncbi:phospholipid/cholesterol/gamma-HCH transport system substrate-binding protein [Flexibacter flexilis DSM 6793]|uniref:Phospholipid/cholesterol/gamma-HCH transport system substrate-binding protein n=1 Tax=Flexibacter flexilis DSM 6793 TaxID=927664 RepID=A0A1I1I3U4_9BACT|nr:MlaD family protein [Flexibacter flexilis]SFC30472.1 phospholipid/cholesterol/gamma-HCH transport system substrate-binding protein [Flexibacter flexilis DSM 6793]
MNFSKEFKVGLLSVVSGTVLYFGVDFLKGTDFMSSTNRYFAIYDNVEGLTVSNPVMVNGFSVGRVEKIMLVPNRTDLLCVSLVIDKNIPLTDSSVAILADGDLLGGKLIELKIGKGKKAIADEDTLISGNSESITESLKARALPVLDQLDSTAAQLTVVMKGLTKTTQQVNATLADFEATSKSVRGIMDDNRGSFKGTMQNVNRISAALITTQKEVNTLITKMNRFGDTLNAMELGKTVASANKSIENLNGLLGGIKSGKGSLGKLAVNDSLYNNLKNTSADLDKLFIDIKANPKRYVHFSIFGKKTKVTVEK